MYNLFKSIYITILEHKPMRCFIVSLHCGNGSLVFDQSPMGIFQIFYHNIPEVANEIHQHFKHATGGHVQRGQKVCYNFIMKRICLQNLFSCLFFSILGN